MTLLYCDPRFLAHETGAHPERADRIRGIPQRLDELGLSDRCGRPEWQSVSRSRLSQVHAPRYIDEVWALAKSGGGDLDADTIVSPDSYAVALSAVGTVCDAAERIVRSEDRKALCLVRPPGHHAVFDAAMGFCLFNNIAVAARMAVDELKLDRVLIVDWDIHHGNGTQATFWEDPSVGFFSSHRWPFYPGTGSADETGGGDGLGTTVNLPFPFGVSRADYLAKFRGELGDFADKMKPQLVLISAGFDSHRLDPVGDLGLETEDFAALTRAVLDVAATHADGRVLSVLEGGYNPQIMPDCVATHLAELLQG